MMKSFLRAIIHYVKRVYTQGNRGKYDEVILKSHHTLC